MTPLRKLLLTACCLCPQGAAALELTLPVNAQLEAEQATALTSVHLPKSEWRDGSLEQIAVEGKLIRRAWQVPSSDLSTLQLMAPLRDSLDAAGFFPMFECEARECGGFEFRYAMDLLPEPDMHVDLGDFRYLLAERIADTGTEYAGIVVSRTSDRGFIHATWVGNVGPAEDDFANEAPSGATEPSAATPEPESAQTFPTGAPASLPLDLAAQLETAGHAVLSDLSFTTGSAELEDRSFASLASLEAWLDAHPDAQIVLVGHTDTMGSLAANIDLSRKRAAKVLDRMAERHGIPRSRMAAEGVGYLAPLVTNATEDGRKQNRRVEVVVVGEG